MLITKIYSQTSLQTRGDEVLLTTVQQASLLFEMECCSFVKRKLGINHVNIAGVFLTRIYFGDFYFYFNLSLGFVSVFNLNDYWNINLESKGWQLALLRRRSKLHFHVCYFFIFYLGFAISI